MVTRGSALVALLALVVLTACSPGTAVVDTVPEQPPAAATAGVGGLRIPAIGVDVEQLVPLALAPDRAPEVPPEDDPMVAGWYVFGPQPGAAGPAVILGHVNARGKAGVFARLHELQVGDRVEVDHGGTTVVFEVYERGQYDKDHFPTSRVYGDTDGGRAELHIVTCGGPLGIEASGRHSYEDNVIVFARAVA